MDQDILKEVMSALEQVSDLIYQGNIEQANRLLVVTLQALEQTIMQIEDENGQADMKEKLLEALEAMENEDHILLADILRYEVYESLKKYII
ncbi:MAG: hypothetical protein IJ661_05335 [Lachnospiraceae bacterium]|nr:hypothetical protein [Lachnospiraceae bacterium]